ncbi:MAG: hypothetical protein AAGA90_21530 [Actinomycetota bacterium]
MRMIQLSPGVGAKLRTITVPGRGRTLAVSIHLKRVRVQRSPHPSVADEVHEDVELVLALPFMRHLMTALVGADIEADRLLQDGQGRSTEAEGA